MSLPLAYLAVIIIWSTTPLGIVWSSETIPPSLAVLLRMLIAVLIGAVIIHTRKIHLPWHSTAFRLYSYSALGIFGGMNFSYMAAQYLSSGVLSLIFGLSPVFSALLAKKILAEPKLSASKKWSLLISLAGLAFVCFDSLTVKADSLYGLLYVLLAVFLFSLSGVLVKSVSLAIHPLSTTVGALSLTIPLFFISWLIFDGTLSIEQWQLRSIYATIYLGVFGSLIGFYAYFYVLQQLSASTVALITLITPIIAISLGAVLNNETVSLNLILGTLLVLFGLSLYNWGDKIGNKKSK